MIMNIINPYNESYSACVMNRDFLLFYKEINLEISKFYEYHHSNSIFKYMLSEEQIQIRSIVSGIIPAVGINVYHASVREIK